MLENIKLDKTISLPLYYQLKMILLKEIQKENHPLNIPLPPEEKIASLCCVSRTTVRQAIRELVNEGWLYRIKAKGTFISDNQGKKSIAEYPEKYGVNIYWRGCDLKTELLDFSVSTPINQTISCGPSQDNSMISYLKKRKYCDGCPAAIFRIYQGWEYGLLPKISHVRHIIRTTEANSEDMKLLELSQSEPLQEILSIAFNHQSNVIEYSITRYRGSMCRIEVSDLG